MYMVKCTLKFNKSSSVIYLQKSTERRLVRYSNSRNVRVPSLYEWITDTYSILFNKNFNHSKELPQRPYLYNFSKRIL